MQLVIVESPTKAKTISKFLPKTYRVESSYGHIRDLPQKEMGIDIEHDFLPKYVIPEKAKKQVSKLESLAQRSSSILFATDEDREGEAIAWHLKNILKPKNYERITFHEITKKAIENSLTHPRDIDIDLVNAQQARRILDRLVGYELSPFLWKKVAKGLSAGRVQSVAVRLVVEKEREIEKFKIDEYWTLEAIFNPEENNSATINAKLHAKNNKTLKKLEIKNEEQATELLEELKKQNYSVANIISKENKKKPPEPFRTSTLQQAANQKLGFSSKETMMLAQQLYEGIEIKGREQVGLITYMRTDSLNLSEDFLKTCKDYIDNNFGSQYAPKTIRRFKTKSKGAQEAHEAIRPTHIDFIPENIRASLSPKQFKLYDLIWRRTLACQMADALLEATTIDINTEDNVYTFRATGQTIKFDGFLKIYRTATEETLLPKVNEKEKMNLKELTPKQHFTQPPARYSEATLIKTLEEYGIGRPSTYAPTLMTIQDRKYVVKEEKKFKPTEMGFLVTDILVEHFPKIVDFKFTAEMEEDLDKIAEGKKEWTPIIRAFYTPFKKNLEQKSEKLSKKDMFEETTDEKCEKCGSPMVIKLGRYGKFLACSNYPECKNTKNISGQPGKEPAELELSDEKCELCGAPLAQKVGRYGKFLGCSKYPECKYIKKFSQKTG
ncbi:type I DNA topoisomerase, partial [Patescibacteria group bacterium]|nr:type I DNA topoisomerase [Patescibacteria group bacterium]